MSDETDMQMAAREGFAKLRALRSRIPRARRTSALQQLRQAGDVLKHRRRGAVRRQRQRHRPRRGPRDPGQRRVVRRFLRGRQRDAHLPHRRRVHLRTAHDSPARVGRLPRRLSLRSERLLVPVRCAGGCTVRSRLTMRGGSRRINLAANKRRFGAARQRLLLRLSKRARHRMARAPKPLSVRLHTVILGPRGTCTFWCRARFSPRCRPLAGASHLNDSLSKPSVSRRLGVSRSRRVAWHRCVQRPDRCWFRRDDRCFPARPRARTVASESASPKRLINWSLPVGSSSDQSCWSTPDVPSARP